MTQDPIPPSRRDFLRASVFAAGAGEGASGFLMAMAMPALAIECVLEGKPWPGYFQVSRHPTLDFSRVRNPGQ